MTGGTSSSASGSSKYYIKSVPHLGDYNHVVKEILDSLLPFFHHLESNGKGETAELYFSVFKSIVEPEQVHRWKAVWEDDQGNMQINTCWRVQQNSALGPYKGGLRFDDVVCEDTLRFLALEQTFKNALTGKQMGGAKGGSDFSPKNKSDRELKRFCEVFMRGLSRIIGPDIDVPAGDIGVNSKVIGYLYGSWKNLGQPHVGVLTGKSLLLSGSMLRNEATGYGLIYLLRNLLESKMPNTIKDQAKPLLGKRILISGCGNVATFSAKKACALGGIVLSMSDRKFVYWAQDAKKGLSCEDVDAILSFKESLEDSDSILQLTKTAHVELLKVNADVPNAWAAHKDVAVDFVLPCATQNEIDEKAAKSLVFERGVSALVEGSNLSSTAEAMEVYREREDRDGKDAKSAAGRSFYYIGSKLANLGGVATSYLEMQQNACKDKWESEKVDNELCSIMEKAFHLANEAAEEYNVSMAEGANIAAFKKVADAMLQLGFA